MDWIYNSELIRTQERLQISKLIIVLLYYIIPVSLIILYVRGSNRFFGDGGPRPQTALKFVVAYYFIMYLLRSKILSKLIGWIWYHGFKSYMNRMEVRRSVVEQKGKDQAREMRESTFEKIKQMANQIVKGVDGVQEVEREMNKERDTDLFNILKDTVGWIDDLNTWVPIAPPLDTEGQINILIPAWYDVVYYTVGLRGKEREEAMEIWTAMIENHRYQLTLLYDDTPIPQT